MLRDQTRLDGAPCTGASGYRGPAADDPCAALVAPRCAADRPADHRAGRSGRGPHVLARCGGGHRWHDDDEARTALEELVDREVLRQAKTTSVAGQTEYTFRHVLVRDVAYGRIPRVERAHKHRATAGWLSTALGEGGADREERLASHYTEAHDLARAAGDPMASSMADEAVEHLLAAARRAAGLDPARSLAHARRALELMAPNDPRRARSLMAAGTAALVSGRFDEADEDLHQAVEAFVLHDDEIGAADATVMLARSRSSAATSRGRTAPEPSDRRARVASARARARARGDPHGGPPVDRGRPARMHVVVGAGAHARA